MSCAARERERESDALRPPPRETDAADGTRVTSSFRADGRASSPSPLRDCRANWPGAGAIASSGFGVRPGSVGRFRARASATDFAHLARSAVRALRHFGGARRSLGAPAARQLHFGCCAATASPGSRAGASRRCGRAGERRTPARRGSAAGRDRRRRGSTRRGAMRGGSCARPRLGAGAALSGAAPR